MTKSGTITIAIDTPDVDALKNAITGANLEDHNNGEGDCAGWTKVPNDAIGSLRANVTGNADGINVALSHDALYLHWCAGATYVSWWSGINLPKTVDGWAVGLKKDSAALTPQFEGSDFNAFYNAFAPGRLDGDNGIRGQGADNKITIGDLVEQTNYTDLATQATLTRTITLTKGGTTVEIPLTIDRSDLTIVTVPYTAA